MMTKMNVTYDKDMNIESVNIELSRASVVAALFLAMVYDCTH